LSVSSRNTAIASLPIISDCEYGDSVKLNGKDGSSSFAVHEIAVLRKYGKQNSMPLEY
jgi:hypothetical protein